MRMLVTAGVAIGAGMLAAGAASAADYVVVRHTAEVAGTPEAVWTRIGDYCTVSQLLSIACRITAGNGDVGTIRALGPDGATMEPLLARTPTSYTYGQFAGGMKDYDYHGTLAVEAAGRGRSRIVYTITYDAARMPSDEVRAQQRARIDARFGSAVERAVQLAAGKPATAPLRP